jgi:hypothetical protein
MEALIVSDHLDSSQSPDQRLTYFEAVASRLFSLDGCKYRGLECYAAKKVVDVAAMALMYSVATGRVGLPKLVTKFCRGPLYVMNSYRRGIKAALILCIPIDCLGFYLLSTRPLANGDVARQREWGQHSAVVRLRYLRSMIGRTILEHACYIVCLWTALAVVARHRIFPGFFSGFCGWVDAMIVAAMLFKLVGGIAVWNLKPSSKEVPLSDNEWGWGKL